MSLHAFIKIGGYPIDSMRDQYRRWLFVREDRIIRTRTKGQRNLITHALPDDPSEWNEPETDYLYLTRADTLHRRLATAGYDRSSLELEFLKYRNMVFKHSNPPYFFQDHYLKTAKTAHARAEAFRKATLNDWLDALGDAVKSRIHYWTRSHEGLTPSNLLVDIVTGRDSPNFDGIMPRHLLSGFPCTSLECMAVAMLEIVPDDAECVLDVSNIVEYGPTYCFEDLILSGRSST